MSDPSAPPMDPNTSEATAKQLELAREQGDAYGRALTCMTQEVAHDGGEQQAGRYRIGYAVEEAEGIYEGTDNGLVWRDPGDGNVHVEVAVRDAADGRFVPGIRVTATLIDPNGNEVGTHEQPLLWHPMIYHYGRNWTVPADGAYTMRVRVEPPTFMRHDQINGQRFTELVEVGVQRRAGAARPGLTRHRRRVDGGTRHRLVSDDGAVAIATARGGRRPCSAEDRSPERNTRTQQVPLHA